MEVGFKMNVFPRTRKTLRRIIDGNGGLELEGTQTLSPGERKRTQENLTKNGKNHKQTKRPRRKRTQIRRNTRQVSEKFSRSRRKRTRKGPRSRSHKMGRRKGRRIRKQVAPIDRDIKYLGALQARHMTVFRREGHEGSLKLLEPRTTNVTDGIRVVGSEFLQFIEVNTSNSTLPAPTKAGDILKIMVLMPHLMGGTRIAQLASMYQRYKFNSCLFEYVPQVPMIQDGALMMFVGYDPVENYSINTSDSNQLMRLAFDHKGSNLFPVIQHGRTTLSKRENAFKTYFNGGYDEDVREEVQGNLYIVAGSGYTPYDGSALKVTLGSIYMHYDVTFKARMVTDPVTTNQTSIEQTAGASMNACFNVPATDGIICWHPALLPPDIDVLYIFYFRSGVTVSGNPVQCYDESGQHVLGAQGSIWYGSSSAPSDGVYIYTNIQDAMDKNVHEGLRWVSVPSAVAVTSFYVDIDLLDLKCEM